MFRNFLFNKTRRYFFVFCFIFFIIINSFVVADDDSLPKTWIIGATEFDASELPLYRQTVGSIFPKLLLEKLQGLSSHGYMPDEKNFLASVSTQKKQIDAINKLQSLLTSRDELSFNDYSEDEIKKKKKKLDEEIILARKNLEEINKITNEKKSELSFSDYVPIEFWNGNKVSGTEFSLFSPPQGVSNVVAMKSGKLSGMITGKITQIEDYVYVTMFLYVYPIENPVIETFEAGSWDQLPDLAESLARKILPGVVGQPPAIMTLETMPEDASVYIDGNLLDRTRETIPVNAGKHTILVEAEGFYSATLDAFFESGNPFVLRCDLAPVVTTDITLNISVSPEQNKDAVFFIEGLKLSDNPVVFPMPEYPVIGFVRVPSKESEKSLFSWFVIEPNKKVEYNVPLDTDDISELIEHRRNVLYWSLGAFYLYLPVPMLVYGQATDLYNSYSAGYLPQTQKEIDRVNAWGTGSNIATGVAVGLGANLFVQIIRYIIVADKVKPDILR